MTNITLVYTVHERPTGGILFRAEETANTDTADCFGEALPKLLAALRDGMDAELIISRKVESAGKPDFWTAFDRVESRALASPVGKVMSAAGYEVQHTGGGCMAWQRAVPGGYAWICDLDNGLGDSPDEAYLVGVYDDESSIAAQGDAPNLAAAIAWMDARLSNLIAPLISEYDVWLKANGLPEMSADELVCEEEKTSKEQRIWLRDFCDRWETATKLDNARDRGAKHGD